MTEDEEFECASVLNSHSQDVKHIVFHPHLDILASCSYDDTAKLYKEESDDWECFATLKGHESTVWSLDFDKTGSRIVTSSGDTTLRIWQEYKPNNPHNVATPDNVPVWKCVCVLSGFHERPVYDVKWCHLTGCIASAAGDDSVTVYKEIPSQDQINAPNFEIVTRVKGAHSEDVNCVAWNPKEEGLLASCSDDGKIKLWKLSSE